MRNFILPLSTAHTYTQQTKRTHIMHIGHRIQEVLNEQRRPASWLASEIFVSRTHIYKIFEKPSLDCVMLLRISRALDHDFFAELSLRLKADDR